MPKIHPCLWFNDQAEEAARFYTSLFSHSKIGKIARYGEAGAEISGQKKGSVMTVDFEIGGLKVTGLNGGPIFQFTPAMSFFVWCETDEEIDGLWRKLSEGGKARMELDKYPWAEKYGWTTDSYGVEWQLMKATGPAKIAPAFLFVDEMFGKGEKALEHYASVFENFKIESVARDEQSNSILHCRFSMAGQAFALMEGPGTHGYGFTEGFSLVVTADTQEECDRYSNALSAVPSAEQCGWLKDKFGVSWQIVPAQLESLVDDSANSENMMKAMLKMKRLDIAKLKQAYEAG